MLSVTASELRRRLPELAAMVEGDGHRILVTRQGKPWFALIPADEAQIIAEREDRLDSEAAREALAEPGENIPWEQVKRELGL